MPRIIKAGRNKTEKLLDEVKDAIDRLHEIKAAKARKAAAQDLAEYLALHHEVHA
jgi:hypothetical protein